MLIYTAFKYIILLYIMQNCKNYKLDIVALYCILCCKVLIINKLYA